MSSGEKTRYTSMIVGKKGTFGLFLVCLCLFYALQIRLLEKLMLMSYEHDLSST